MWYHHQIVREMTRKLVMLIFYIFFWDIWWIKPTTNMLNIRQIAIRIIETWSYHAILKIQYRLFSVIYITFSCNCKKLAREVSSETQSIVMCAFIRIEEKVRVCYETKQKTTTSKWFESAMLCRIWHGLFSYIYNRIN